MKSFFHSSSGNAYRHRGNRGDRDNPRTRSHPIFRSRTSSRRLFRDYLKPRRWFGLKPGPVTADHSDKPKKDKPSDLKISRWKYLRRYFSIFHDRKMSLAALMALTVVGVAMHAVMPWMTKFMLDDILPRKDFKLLALAAGGLMVALLLSLGAGVLQSLISRRLLGTIVNKMKRKMMARLQHMPLHRIQELKVGGIVSRLQSDTEGMNGLIHEVLLMPLHAVLLLIVSLSSLSMINLHVMTICLFFSGLMLIVAYLFFNVMLPFRKDLRQEVAMIGAHLTETFGGICVVRAFGSERAEAHAYAVDSHLNWRKKLHADVANILVERTARLIHGMLTVTIWLTGGYFFIHDQLRVGELMAFFFFMDMLFHPVFMIMASFTHMQHSLACAERTFDLLDEKVDMPDRLDSLPAQDLTRAFDFDKVTFSYPDGTQALAGISFSIPRGTMTALVGPSGAGKSTVINLLMRFYDPTDGVILLDGRDVRDFKLSEYRRLFSLVLQDVFLFDGSLRENIAYGRPDAKMDEIEAAARAAHCHEFITKLERQYETFVGERGVKLSGGEKQRVALARAILMKSQILILDEATSSVDSESEELIQDALRKLFSHCTTVVIAHRLSTVMDAAQIIVVDNGLKIEEGNHEELLRKHGRYHDLFTKQMLKADRQRQILDWNADEKNGGTPKAGAVAK